MDSEKSLMVKCECGGEALEVTYWPNKDCEDEICFSYWKEGFYRPMCWRERLRWCWRILRTGNPWSDSILMYPPQAKQVADFIRENLQQQNDKKEIKSN